MSIRIKSPKEIEVLETGGKRHAAILKELANMVAPGVSTLDLEAKTKELIKQNDDQAAFLGYRPESARRPYPAALCTSVNDVIVHGIPTENPIVLEEGDIITLDLGYKHNGMITDAAVTVPVGTVDPIAQKLIEATRKALSVGIQAVKPGRHVGDIGAAIEKFVDTTEFYSANDLAGHGVGYEVHEDPYVPNWGHKGEGPKIEPGMVFAIEPMLLVGGSEVRFDKDEYTVRTADGGLSAHFEHTVAVTNTGYQVLTQ